MIWRKGKVLQEWRYAEVVWIPKEENASNIKLFKTIFKTVTKWLTEYLFKNNYIDTFVQKGGVPRVVAFHCGQVRSSMKI